MHMTQTARLSARSGSEHIKNQAPGPTARALFCLSSVGADDSVRPLVRNIVLFEQCRFAGGPLASPRGSCLRSFAPQTDEGRGAAAFSWACKANRKCSPTLIRPSVRTGAPSPRGRYGLPAFRRCVVDMAACAYFFTFHYSLLLKTNSPGGVGRRGRVCITVLIWQILSSAGRSGAGRLLFRAWSRPG